MVNDFLNIELLRQIDQTGFVDAVAEMFSIDRAALSAFLKYYDIAPKGFLSPPTDSEPADLVDYEIAKAVNLPTSVIHRLQDVGAISSPVTCGDLSFLHSYRCAWADAHLVERQFKSLKKAQRQMIYEIKELDEEWKMYVYAVFMFTEKHGKDNSLPKFNKTITIDEIAKKVEDIYRVQDLDETRIIINIIREIACEDCKMILSGEKTLRTILRSHSLPDTELALWQEIFVFDMYS